MQHWALSYVEIVKVNAGISSTQVFVFHRYCEVEEHVHEILTKIDDAKYRPACRTEDNPYPNPPHPSPSPLLALPARGSHAP
jgi:hypothetical protein